MWRKRASDLHVDFQVELDRDVGSCDVDHKSLKESINNILEYSFEACRLDGREKEHYVRFELSSDEDNAIFVIEDNGIGMDRETHEKIFSLFFTSKGTGGTSLGLFTANKVIEKHHGIIEVDSEHKKGTVFRISIPKVRDDIAPPS